MPGEPTAEIPQGGVSEESISHPPTQQPEIVSVTKPGTFTSSELSLTPLIATETKPTLLDTEWKRILDLGKKSFLDLKPEEIAELQSLTVKGKGLLGDGFNQELTRRNAEAKQQKKDKIDAAFRDITEKFNSGAQTLAKATEQELARQDTKLNATEVTIRQNMVDNEQDKAGKTYEEVLGELQKDPQYSQATAGIQWLDLRMGKTISGIDPELQKKINAFNQNARNMIMENPTKYKEEEAVLKDEFFKSRGIDPQTQPKTGIM